MDEERCAQQAQADLEARIAAFRAVEPQVRGRAWAAVRLEEMRASLRLAGVSISAAEVRAVIERRLTLEARPLRETLTIVGYAGASRWIASHTPARDAPPRSPATILERIRHLHALLTAPEAALVALGAAPIGLPGGWRTTPAAPYADGAVPLPPWSIPTAMEALAARVSAGPATPPSSLWLARLYETLLRIRPFETANGRVARLLVNDVLAAGHLPPCTFAPHRSTQYRGALRRADAGAPAALAVEIAKGVTANLDRLLASTAAEAPLLPLRDLAPETDLARYRKAAQRGKLRHIRQGAAIMTTASWLAAYESTRAPQGRRKS